MQSLPSLAFLNDLPPALIYLVLGGGAAIENVVPLVPADTFVLIGAFLAASGRANLWLVFLSTWIANVASAIMVYGLARKWGPAFFQHAVGRWLLRPAQLERISKFYTLYGTPAILVSRFLPAFRAIVPVFAGITGVTVLRVAVPTAVASAAWYGALVVLGTLASRNLDAILNVFSRMSLVLVIIAAALIALVARWWWKTRREPH